MGSNQSQLDQIYGKVFAAREAFRPRNDYSDCRDFCDLHIHTTASDGQLTPHEVVSHSLALGLRAISVCDHDTLSGYLELAIAYSAGGLGIVNANDVEVIPGIEISSHWGRWELHILGYFIDPENRQFTELLATLRQSRLQRVEVIAEKLASLGMPVEVSRILELSRGDSVGRPHIAEAMVEKGYTSSVKEAFGLYLGIGRPAYAGRLHLSPAQAIEAIQAAKGLAVWAHPGTTGGDWLLNELVECGLQGIEVYHPEHNCALRQKYLNMARKNRLIVTGGSDFHGASSSEGAMIGDSGIPYENVETMKRLAATAIGK